MEALFAFEVTVLVCARNLLRLDVFLDLSTRVDDIQRELPTDTLLLKYFLLDGLNDFNNVGLLLQF